MTVKVIDVFGTDAKVSRMARVSYGVLSEHSETDLPRFIRRLLADGHLVPFEHCALTYYLAVPIFVARQLVRYRTAVISELSLRYTTCTTRDPYIPEGVDTKTEKHFYYAYRDAMSHYQGLIDAGVSCETARAVLPLATPTQMYYTMNLRNLMHLFEQRISAHAQRETRETAHKMFRLALEHFPITMNAFKELHFAADGPNEEQE